MDIRVVIEQVNFVFIVLLITGILENIVTVWSILKSDLRRTTSSVLLINQAVGDILFLITTIFIVLPLLITVDQYEEHVGVSLRLMAVGFIGISSHSQAAMCLNMLVAICYFTKYKNMVTRKRVYIFLACSWMFNGIWPLLHFTTKGFYFRNEHYQKIMIHYSSENWWMGALIMINSVGFPFLASLLSCIVISKTASKISSLNINRGKKLNLAKMIIVNIGLFVLTYIPLHIGDAMPTNIFVGVSAFLHYTYHVSKLFFYLKFYPPLRQSCLLICWLNRKVLPATEGHEMRPQQTGTSLVPVDN